MPEFAESLAGSLPPAPQEVVRAVSKPRLMSIHSESSLTTFANGHHKPSHKHHGSIHGSSPYTIPAIGHTGHNFGEHTGTIKTGPPVPAAASMARRIKSEQSSPDLRIYPALKMPTSGISQLDLTPQQHQPVPARAPHKSSMHRTNASGSFSNLNINTNAHYPLSNDYPEMLSAESEYQFSPGIYPSPASGWNTYLPTSFEDLASADRRYDNSFMYPSAASQVPPPPPVAASSVSGDDPEDAVYSRPSPPYGFGGSAPLSSNSSELADSDNYHLSAASSYVDLNSFPDYDRLLVQGPSMDGYDGELYGTGNRTADLVFGGSQSNFGNDIKLDIEVQSMVMGQQQADDDVLWMRTGGRSTRGGAGIQDQGWH